jgi:hypothetical protein
MAVQILALAGGNLAAIGKYVPVGLAQSMLGIGSAAVGVALSIFIFRRQDLGG